MVAPVFAQSAVKAPAPPPAGYVIGPDDVLSIVFWYEKDMSADAVVRPDGKISLPLLNEIQASGLTPEELRKSITAAANDYVADPRVVVVVKAINSRKVFITGQVHKPGPYPLGGPTTVLQLIAMAGGLQDWADSKKITIIRNENGRPSTYLFNYNDVERRKNVAQNIELKPGDTVMVP
jgi:polysaccharide export outer membrane protein